MVGRPNYLESNVFRYHDTFPHPDWVPKWPELIPEPTEEMARSTRAAAMVLGDPDDALATCREWETVGVDQLVFGIGPAPLEETLETIRLMGEHVIPKIDTDPVPPHDPLPRRRRPPPRPPATWPYHLTRRNSSRAPLFSYEGTRAVVTGAATGVGAALLDVLDELGAAHVTVLDVKAPTGPHQQFLQTDLSDPAAIDAALAAIDGPVDALFNNAGVADTMPRDTVFKVNFLALRRLSEALLERIPEGGAIVNTASTAGGQWPTRLETITELLDIDDWEKALAWYDGRDLGVEPYFFSKELVQVYTMRSAREHHGAGCADEQRVPVTDRHAAARRLPQDDERPRHRLERGPGQREARDRA